MKIILSQAIKALLFIVSAQYLVGCSGDAPDEASGSEAGLQLLPADVIIENVTLVDAGSGTRQGMSVVVRGADIYAVLPSRKIEDSANAKSLDGSGKYLIPGLWDSHVHITFMPELESSMLDLFLANGITSVRDTGGKLDKVLAWRETARFSVAPDVYIAGPLVDGYPSVYSGEREGFPDISETVVSPEDAERAVDQLADAGVDLIKAYEMLSPETFKALLVRAKHHGLPVTGHVPLSMTAIEASAAGLNSIEHTRNFEMDCSAESEQLFQERQAMLAEGQDTPGSILRGKIHAEQHFRAIDNLDEEKCVSALQEISRNNTWQVPTLTLMMASRTAFYTDDDWRATFDYLPEPTRSSWKESTERFKGIVSQPSDARERRAKVSDWKLSLIPQMLDADIRIMAGTDTPIFFLTPGFSLHKELETLVEAGMSPMQAIDSATLAPAEYFGLEDSQGLIEPGYKADLVLLDANPLEDIRNTTKIDMVIKDGVLLDRAALDHLLETTANQGK